MRRIVLDGKLGHQVSLPRFKTMQMLPKYAQSPIFPLRVKTYTFGCRVNQADTERIEDRFGDDPGRFDLASAGDPDVVVINTCTVTEGADRQARQMIRRLHREHPQAEIVVTGCYADPGKKALERIEGVTSVVPIAGQAQLPQLFGSKVGEMTEKRGAKRARRTRAILKVQNGCNAYCSFCPLPKIRGRSASLPLEEVLDEAQRLAAAGHRELVLSGTHVGAYGRDLSPKTRFSDLIGKILQAMPDIWLRISSLEPATLSPDLISLVETEPRIRPHFHIPLQSGSDAVLKRMNRKYGTATYAKKVCALVQTRPDIAIGADVIVGYPGETESEFSDTVSFLKTIPIHYLHVFPFSPRPQTRAAAVMDDVSATEKKRRGAILRAWGNERKREFYERFLGEATQVIFERKRDEQNRLTGITPNYIPIRAESPDRLMETEVEVRLKEIEVGERGMLSVRGEVV